ncbi:MAG: type IV pilus modification PilV family protein [bacterium]
MERATNDTQGRSGYTLFEVLLAAFILSVGLLAMAHVQVSSMRGNTKSANFTSATILAETTIEELKKQVIQSGCSGLTSDEFIGVDPYGDSGGIFTKKWEVTNYSDTENLKKIEVTVSWLENDKTHSISFSTVVSDYFN